MRKWISSRVMSGGCVLTWLVFHLSCLAVAARVLAQEQPSATCEKLIARALHRADELDVEYRRVSHRLARDELEFDELESRLEDLQAKVASSKKAIAKLNALLEMKQPTYKIGGHDFTAAEVATEIKGRSAVLTANEATRLKLVLEARAKKAAIDQANKLRKANSRERVALRKTVVKLNKLKARLKKLLARDPLPARVLNPPEADRVKE